MKSAGQPFRNLSTQLLIYCITYASLNDLVQYGSQIQFGISVPKRRYASARCSENDWDSFQKRS